MRHPIVVASFLIVALWFGGAGAQAVPDHILVGGKVLTVDDDFSVAEAIAVVGDRIVAVGTDAEIRRRAGPETRVTELNGKTVIPGLIDNHVHAIRAGRLWYREARLDGITSRIKALEVIGARAGSLGPGEEVILGGMTPSQFADQPGRFSEQELARAAPGHRVLQLRPYFDRRSLGEMAPEVWARSLKQLMADFNRAGLTTIWDAGGFNISADMYTPVRKLAESGDLTLRIFHSFNEAFGAGSSADDIVRSLKATAPTAGDDVFGRLGFGEITFMGVRDELFQPWRAQGNALEDYLRIAAAGAEAGWQFREHTHQDQKMSAFLDVVEKVDRTHPIGELRWAFDHALGIRPETIERAKRLGVALAVHSLPIRFGDIMLRRLGEETRNMPLLRTIQESGIRWGLGTDSAVYKPFLTLWWAVTGKSASGRRILNQTVSRKDALIAHTRSNAYLLFREKVLGSIEPGKYADLVVLDRDYMTVAADEIKDIRPVLTMMGGKVVFRSDEKGVGESR